MRAAQVKLGARLYNATVHINAMGNDQNLLFQTTPGRLPDSPGGHRSVLRCALDTPPDEHAAHRRIDLTVVSTSTGEWAFAIPGVLQQPDAQVRTIEVDVPAEMIILSRPVARVDYT